MIERVLVPMDDSDTAEKALRFALDAYPDAEVVALHVVGGASPMMGKLTEIALRDDVTQAGEEQAEPVFERAEAVASEYERTVETAVGFGKPAGHICDRAAKFDTVVIGSHGGSISDRVFGGNVTRSVVKHAPVPVTIVR